MDNVDNTDNIRKRTTAPPVWCFARPACLYLQQNREAESLNAARIWTTWTIWTTTRRVEAVYKTHERPPPTNRERPKMITSKYGQRRPTNIRRYIYTAKIRKAAHKTESQRGKVKHPAEGVQIARPNMDNVDNMDKRPTC